MALSPLRWTFLRVLRLLRPRQRRTTPLTVDLSEYVYLQYSVAFSADLVIMAENCRAT